MNPMQMMQMKSRLDIFKTQHPKVLPFLQAARGYVQEGTVIEVKLTTPDGRTLESNIRVTEDDVKTVGMLQ